MKAIFVMAEGIRCEGVGVLPGHGKDSKLVKGSDKGDASSEDVGGIGLGRKDFFQASVRMYHETPRHVCNLRGGIVSHSTLNAACRHIP